MLQVKIEESEKAGSRRETNQGHLWLEPPSALPLSHDSRMTTNPHNPGVGAYAQDKSTSAGLCAKKARGAYA